MANTLATVHVGLRDRAYDIVIGQDLLESSAARIGNWTHLRHGVVIADANVQRYADVVRRSILEASARCDLLIVNPGEPSKNVSAAEDLWIQMLAAGADRKSVVIAVGGGVVGDLAGFVAATFARGVPFVQVPTTLLAHVDSSVGGKVGINLPAAKNMVGAFWQPRGVIIDTSTLDSLPDREYRAGLAEVVKYGVILDAGFLEFLESHVADLNDRNPDVLRRVIQRCCELKADVVVKDEREESGLRAVLNYGHTFCHAIEAVAGYGEYLHGEAVAIGMLCASRLAESLGRISTADTERQKNLLEALALPLEIGPLDIDALLEAMQRDKKVEDGKLRFVLPTHIGRVELVDGVPANLVREAWRP